MTVFKLSEDLKEEYTDSFQHAIECLMNNNNKNILPVYYVYDNTPEFQIINEKLYAVFVIKKQGDLIRKINVNKGNKLGVYIHDTKISTYTVDWLPIFLIMYNSVYFYVEIQQENESNNIAITYESSVLNSDSRKNWMNEEKISIPEYNIEIEQGAVIVCL